MPTDPSPSGLFYCWMTFRRIEPRRHYSRVTTTPTQHAGKQAERATYELLPPMRNTESA